MTVTPAQIIDILQNCQRTITEATATPGPLSIDKAMAVQAAARRVESFITHIRGAPPARSLIGRIIRIISGLPTEPVRELMEEEIPNADQSATIIGHVKAIEAHLEHHAESLDDFLATGDTVRALRKMISKVRQANSQLYASIAPVLVEN